MPVQTVPQLPPSASWTSYNPAPGTDPEWDAYLATFTARVGLRNADADRQRGKLQTEYDAGISRFDLDAPEERQNLEASFLARGIGRSGEAMGKRSALESDLYGRRANADRSRLEGYEAIDAGLAAQFGDLSAEREGKIADSRLRLLADNKAVGTVDTPGVGVGAGYTPKKPTVPKPAKPPTARARPIPPVPTAPKWTPPKPAKKSSGRAI